jgi:hypothetical protein
LDDGQISLAFPLSDGPQKGQLFFGVKPAWGGVFLFFDQDLLENIKGTFSNQALLFGPTEKAAQGNQPPIDGGRFQAFLNQAAFVLLNVSVVNGLGVKVLSGCLLKPTGKGGQVMAAGPDRVWAFSHLGQVVSVLVCNILFRSHENIILRVFSWLMVGFGKVFLEIPAFLAG